MTLLRVMACVCGVGILLGCTASSSVTFATFGGSAPGSQVTGFLSKPEGPGPFPGVLVSHPCGGVSAHTHELARMLMSWGYVTLVVDSFTSRGVTLPCSPQIPHESVIAADIYGAAAFLRSLPYIASDRIGAVGTSHGGGAVLIAASEAMIRRAPTPPIKAAVAYYPNCNVLNSYSGYTAPMLILIGDDDNWTPAERCDRVRQIAGPGLEFVLLKGARHGFDQSGGLRYVGRYAMAYDYAAASEAERRMREFLRRHLR